MNRMMDLDMWALDALADDIEALAALMERLNYPAPVQV